MRTLLVVLLLAGPAFAEANASHFNGALTRGELESEYRRIDSERPGLGMPIAFMAGGGGGVLVGSFLILTAEGYSFAIILGGLFAVAGGVFIVVGVINLIIRIVRRNECDAQLAEINARLDALDRNEAPPPPPPGFDNGPPPPPPPPPLPPGASWQGPESRMLLASF